ncbi:PAS domain-containing sensor histidine kinase [Mucilaginibacter panaciglaebae]|uniref:histidine kinase n=1 Tax=Mucilaginibacter panaciglaebae TaxID=502331 RepID=A0ABP7X4P8_9SPHI
MRNNTLTLLRQKAENILAEHKPADTRATQLEVNKLFHELQVYQLELEMQVEELRNITIELETQKKKFQHLFNAAPVGYLIVNKHGIIRDTNKMVVKLLKQDKQMLLSKPLSTFIHFDDIELFYMFLRHLMKVRIPQQCTVRIRVDNANCLTVRLSAISLDLDESDSYCYITLTDITESEQAQEKLQEANRRLELALDASGTGIWEVDIRTGGIVLDQDSQRLLDVRPFGFKGNLDGLLELIHPADRDKFQEELRYSITAGCNFNQVFRNFSTAENLCYFQARAKRIDTDYHKFIGTITNVTEKMKLEEEARALKEKQQQAVIAATIDAEEKERKRVSEALHNGIGQLLYGLKLSLGPIQNTQPEIFKQINQLLTQAIHDTRNISHELAPGTLVDFGLKAALEEMAGRFAGQVHFNLQVLGISAKSDRNLLLSIYRIVQELVNNSLRHGKADALKIGIERTKKAITIEVTDNGCGFGANAGERFGNGLAGIKNRLLVYNGSLDIKSTAGAGASVKIVLKQFPV